MRAFVATMEKEDDAEKWTGNNLQGFVAAQSLELRREAAKIKQETPNDPRTKKWRVLKSR
jgi:hypothetical protein